LLDPEAKVSGALIDAYRSHSRVTSLDAALVEPLVGKLESLSRQTPSCVQARRLCDDMLSALLATPKPFKQFDPRIRDALALLRELPESKASVRDIAESVGLSESRFMHLFKEQVGIPVRRHLLWLRLMGALDSVLAGQSLTTAAHEAGFADSAHLSRTFRDMFGMTLSGCFKNSRFLQVISCSR
jgi:AraC-like DNA-binding protein